MPFGRKSLIGGLELLRCADHMVIRDHHDSGFFDTLIEFALVHNLLPQVQIAADQHFRAYGVEH
ncbi:hypothetical protein D3C78_1993980 [compost metagenome]